MLKRSVWWASALAVLVGVLACSGTLALFTDTMQPTAGYENIVYSLLFGLLAGAVTALFTCLHVQRRTEQCMNGIIQVLEQLRQGVRDSKHITIQDAFLPGQARVGELLMQISQASEKVHSERARADDMLNNMNEGLVALDNALTIVVMNKRAAEFFKSGDENMLGQNLLHLTHMPRLIEAATQTIATGQADSFDWEDTERRLTLQISISAVNGIVAEKSNGVILLITDVTAVRRTEQIRSEFVANASHELKTPLTAIKGFVELMEADIITEPEQVKEYLGRIQKETERMIELINDILHLSELESVNADVGFTTVSMKLTAQRAVESVALSAHKRNITVEVKGDMGTLRANPDRMTQLALNLIDNAVKYNKPDGRVQVEISSKDGNVLFCVSDTGVGIPPDSTQRIFERFYRVDKGRSRRQGGTGLGLSIVKHIVGLYRGHIEIESAVGKGTTITVILPANL
ncbi:sensor histidine kinase [Ethanoligenens sp.]|uniref:sensor histidine kinase n=1 Tax=Ethanoligenens sp. TaxID=2099655 RepID=UPI0039ED0A4E